MMTCKECKHYRGNGTCTFDRICPGKRRQLEQAIPDFLRDLFKK